MECLFDQVSSADVKGVGALRLQSVLEKMGPILTPPAGCEHRQGERLFASFPCGAVSASAVLWRRTWSRHCPIASHSPVQVVQFEGSR
jgi:hypothetical protein